MKQILYLLLIAALTSCIKDTEYRTYTIRRAERSIRPEIIESARLQAARQLEDPGSFVLLNNTMYVNEKDKGIHVIDYSNPGNPVNKGFIPIPGNRGVSLKENYLYADCYMDLFVFSVRSSDDIHFEKTISNVFPNRELPANADSSVIKTTWSYKDTTVTDAFYNQQRQYFDSYSGSAVPGAAIYPTGGNSVGSSLSVFTITRDHLYALSGNYLKTFTLADKQNPQLEDSQFLIGEIESIFPFKDNLFMGSTTGMSIYSISDPSHPAMSGRFSHARVCDPVIADDKFAFVTLRSGNTCGGFTNQMDVLNIEDLRSPVLLKSYPFSNPHGLSKDGNVLFVCDGNAGLKVLDAADVTNVTLKQTLSIGNVLDVVALNQLAFVMLDNAIKIYTYDQQFNIQLKSSIIIH